MQSISHDIIPASFSSQFCPDVCRGLVARHGEVETAHQQFQPEPPLGISPKRGFGVPGVHKSALDFSQADFSSGVNDIFKSVQHYSTVSSNPRSGTPARTPPTRAAKPPIIFALPTVENIRKKTQWTISRELGESENGEMVTVLWQNTVVPHWCLRMDKISGRAYRKVDCMKHYIAEKGRGECDHRGQIMWNCPWEPSEIPKALVKMNSIADGETDSTSNSKSAADLDTASDINPNSEPESQSDSEADRLGTNSELEPPTTLAES